jgi:hypothetical protein
MTDQQLRDQQPGQQLGEPTSHRDALAERRENEAVIRDALSVIDEALAQMMRRELVSSGEVADLLLDVRTLLTASAPAGAGPTR